MDVAPILKALRRNTTGPFLVIAQIALTLAIVSNVVSVIADRATLIARPTGIAEREVFAIGFVFTKGVRTNALQEADLANVRATANVVDAVGANGYPLRGGGWDDGISTKPGITNYGEQDAQAEVYALDQHGIGTLGLKLVEGRNFKPAEVIPGQFNAPPIPDVAIISRSLERQLFRAGPALGKTIYVASAPRKPVTVIGVVDRLQSTQAATMTEEHASENSIILPIVAAGGVGLFIVHVKAGTLDTTMPNVMKALVRENPNRIFGRLRPFTEIRSTAYEKDRSIAIALGILCVILVVITALGIVALTSLWVVRRRTQIGIRRALGATRPAVVGNFLTENALLCFSGAALGALASEGLNLLLRTRYGVGPLPIADLLLCALAVILLGQIAALRPALLAARVSPSEALRSM
ncbi:MAG TPA: FtsX-like permease family protein [Steroidobacteraceae bacterium]|jgi:putative ABC transport system permease protein|nr:FtsX-like permease family protein [Steroidobacteraceae bacterium]